MNRILQDRKEIFLLLLLWLKSKNRVRKTILILYKETQKILQSIAIPHFSPSQKFPYLL